MELSDKIRQTIRNVKDYPKLGIDVKDITPVFASALLIEGDHSAIGE